MKLPLYQQVALLKDYPEQSLLAGDVVTTVDFLESPEQGTPDGYFVEAFDALGKTIAVFVVYETDIKLLTHDDMLHVRRNLPPTYQLVVLDEETMASLESPSPSIPSNAITVDLSDEQLRQKGISREDIKLQLALYLFQEDLFSLGKASEFAGIHPAQFQKEMAKRQIPVHYDADDYRKDTVSVAKQQHLLTDYRKVS